ncbi:DUF4252 domain-containing protein [Myroides odoratimimus]|uniref:DUF4252 domain-containing protein n=1 Tax=Myroides odoratimimus TaxID=76832 RepID=UPI002DBA02DC|nr:DUF4252 domain-containing protein [Myroides odoratimimus]MEC4054314.1 DUF4252 domain-containing protein [Myroides odoratimimus]
MKNTVKAIFIFLFTLSTINTFAQDEFQAFEKNKQVNAVVVNQKMFEMMANVKVEPTSQEEKAYLNLIKKLTSLRVFNTASASLKEEMKAAVSKHVSSASLKEFSSNKDNSGNITIYINQNGSANNISNLLLFNENSKENIVMILTGQFSLNEISSLTSKMNLPIGDSLNKIK